MVSKLKGQRVLFCGSSGSDIAEDLLIKTLYVIKKTVLHVLNENGGIVVGVGNEPLHDNGVTPRIFDWVVLETIHDYLQENTLEWPDYYGSPIIIVCFHNFNEKIPMNRRGLWDKIVQHNSVQIIVIPERLKYGGFLRKTQSKNSNIMVSFGGSVGVYDFLEKFSSEKKHALPQNISLDKVKSASEVGYQQVIDGTQKYFSFLPEHKSIGIYSQLTNELLLNNPEKYVEYLCSIIDGLTKPKVFYVRLLNQDNCCYDIVESYFRNVVDPIINEAGFFSYESGTDIIEKGLMNLEIFTQIYSSSLVIVDLTEMRPNCLFEYGFAQGLDKKLICIAKKGTVLPWDLSAIPCHFWSRTDPDEKRIQDLKEFMTKNINRDQIYIV